MKGVVAHVEKRTTNGRGGGGRVKYVNMKKKHEKTGKEKGEDGKKRKFGFFTATTADARFLYDEVIVKRTYIREGRVHLPEYGATVIDVGANVGLFTCLCAAEQHARGAHVIAVEPNPSCCAAMELNLHRHDGALASLRREHQQQEKERQDARTTSTTRVDVVCAAAGDGSDTKDGVELTVYPCIGGWGSTKPDEEEVMRGMRCFVDALMQGSLRDARSAAGISGVIGRVACMFVPRTLVVAGFLRFVAARWLAQRTTMQCTSTTLSEIIRQYGEAKGNIDLIKIDVERAELAVLQGIDSRDWARVQQFVIEAHEDTLDDVTALLRERGYRLTIEENTAGLSLVYATLL